MKQSNNIRIIRKPVGFFLVILFCGYFGSASLFPHSHIVDGVTIVHSHPYKPSPGNAPVNHNHSSNGFHLIQFLTGFIAAAIVFFTITAGLRQVLNVLFPAKDEFFRVSLNTSSANRPRGPTLLLHN